jgi:type IV pilus assembly protein PilE
MKAHQGFSLIELMIAVAIAAILAAVAIPAYRDYVIRGRLTDAYATLAAQRVRMEQFYQDMRTYTGACTAGTVAPAPADTADFDYTCTIPDGQSYTITATGLGSVAGFGFSIDQNNTRTTTAVPADWTRPAGNCWSRNKQGHC